MYHMKNIIVHVDDIVLPNCMYSMKNVYNFNSTDNTNDRIDLKISEQVIKFLKISDKDMMELEQRQDLLLKKLDVLYERILKISSICNTKNISKSSVKPASVISAIKTPDEIVISTSPDNLPWYLYLLWKNGETALNLAWHVHSSVPKEKLSKIKEFVKVFNITGCSSRINFRLIFTSVSADTELKMSSLAIPIVGDVNVLRYLSLLYPNIFLSYEDHNMDSLLDICYLLQKSTEKSKEANARKLFSQCNGWIYSKQFSIVDVAAYNVIKQWKNSPKFVPSDWLKKCGKLYQ